LLNPPALSVDELFVAVFARIVSLVLLISSLLAGLIAALGVVSLFRPLGTWNAPEMIGLLAGLGVVFHAGAAATMLVFLRKPADHEWLRLGRPAWVSMLVLCYVAGLGIGVVSTA
jgi:hypothetical protein